MQGSRNALLSALLALFLVQFSVASVSHELQHVGERLALISADAESQTTDYFDNTLCSTCLSLNVLGWSGAVSHSCIGASLATHLSPEPTSSQVESRSKTLFLIRAPPTLA